jgi:hypothetical protein
MARIKGVSLLQLISLATLIVRTPPRIHTRTHYHTPQLVKNSTGPIPRIAQMFATDVAYLVILHSTVCLSCLRTFGIGLFATANIRPSSPKTNPATANMGLRMWLPLLPLGMGTGPGLGRNRSTLTWTLQNSYPGGYGSKPDPHMHGSTTGLRIGHLGHICFGPDKVSFRCFCKQIEW